MKRVFIQTNIPVPYKVDFYNELGKMCDLTVIFESRRIDKQKFNWNDGKNQHFKAIYLNEQLNEHKVNFCILKYIDRKKFDVFVIAAFHTFTGQLALWALKLKNIPYCFETDGAFRPLKESQLKFIYKKWLVSGASKYLSPSLVSDNYLNYYGVKNKDIYRYPFASTLASEVLNVPLLDKEKYLLKVKYGIKEDKVIIGVGQFIPRKGFDVLLNSLALLNNPKVGCYIIGGTPTEDYLNIIKNNSLQNIHFLPFLDRKTLAEYYRLSDVFVLPTREDIWGLVINEAMANGLPVITTDKCNAGLAMVTNENGAIIPVDSVEKLATSLNFILSDDTLRHSMGEKSLETIHDFTIEKMAEKHAEVLL